MKLKTTLYLVLIAITLVPLIIEGVGSIVAVSDNLHQQKQQELYAIARAKQANLESHLETMTMMAKGLAETGTIISYLYNLNNPRANTENLRALALDRIRAFQEAGWGIYHHVFITDPKGKVVLSPPHGKSKNNHLGEDLSESKFFNDALNEVQVTDFYGFAETTHYHQLLMQPVKFNDRTLGVIVIELEIAWATKLLEQNFQLGETGRIFLTSLEMERVVKLKTDREPPLDSEPLREVMSKGTIYGSFLNDIGTDVIGAYLKSEKYPWVLAVEIDRDEAFANVDSFVTGLAIFIGILTVIVAFLINFVITNMVAKPIQNILETFTTESAKIKSGADQAKTVSQTLSRMSNRNAATMEEVASSTDELLAIVKHNTSNAGTITQAVEASKETFNEFQDGIDNLIAGFREVADTNAKIHEVIGIIEEFSFQTNLLALNAAVEAARAGDSGKGFAVVAEAVRSLAQQTDESSKTVKELIIQAVEASDNGRKVVDETQKSFKDMFEQNDKITSMIEEIVVSGTEQLDGLNAIAESMTELDNAVQEQASSSNDVLTVSSELNAGVSELNRFIAEFKDRWSGDENADYSSDDDGDGGLMDKFKGIKKLFAKAS